MSNNFSHLSIPIGVDDYQKLIDNKNFYVDKTLLIKEFWQDGAEVVLTPRPRRFGKTLNLSMLRYFFEKTDPDQKTAYLFEKTKIWQDPEYRALQGQFPVIFITFKDIKVDSWESAYTKLAKLLSMHIEKLLAPIQVSLTFLEQQWYMGILKGNATESDYTNSLLYTTTILERHYQKKVIVLIDEYDAPITHAYLKGYYDKIIGFMTNLLSAVLKSNTALKKGLLTGITRISKEDIFSGLNHLSVCTVLTNKYSDKFGFTQEEVDLLLTEYDLYDKKDNIKLWYDGYVFGKTNIYNPWSLLNCIKQEGDFQTYWANTSNNDLIKDLIASSNQAVKDDIELLLQGKVLVDKKINEYVILRDIKKDNQALWGLFLSTGYLTATSRTTIDQDPYYTLAIPNTEIAKLYQDLVARAINQTLQSGQVTELFTALITGNLYNLTALLKEFVVNSCSYYDLPENDLERSLHLFVLGLLAGLSNHYIIQSNRSPHLSAGTPNRESGLGRYDIMLMPRNKQDPGILIEFKKAKSDKQKTLATAAKKALEQIKSLDYATQLRTFDHRSPIFCYGIAAHGKNLVIAMETIK